MLYFEIKCSSAVQSYYAKIEAELVNSNMLGSCRIFVNCNLSCKSGIGRLNSLNGKLFNDNRNNFFLNETFSLNFNILLFDIKWLFSRISNKSR